MLVHAVILTVLVSVVFASTCHAQDEWDVIVSQSARADEGMRVCLEDLVEAGRDQGLVLRIAGDDTMPSTDAIIVGVPDRNSLTGDLVRRGVVALRGMENPQGYEIAVGSDNGRTVVVVAGGSIVGDVYGLYWIWDRLRVLHRMPLEDVRHEPALPHRYTRIQVKSEEDIRRALRYRLNIVYGDNPLHLVPWDSEAESTANQVHRERTRELAEYAHALHMKFFAFGTEFTYHPTLLEEFGATLSPADPKLWEAVRAKFRRLLDAMPELDGVATFTGEEQSYWGEFRSFDVMHADEGCGWSLDKRYRTFVKAVWDVVAGEFDKELLHRTWITNPFEQQSQAEVYERIFTDEVPVKNLYLIPSFTQNDRWWFQAYNPTFNRTPHQMMVVCEPMDYHGGPGVFPTYPGVYFQAGLEWALDVPETNLKGASLDMPGVEGWDTRSLTAYTVARLMWDYRDDPKAIARDFCAIQFGEEAAGPMAEICLMSPVAYKYGLYIEPVAYGAFSSLPHIRVGSFVVDGYPRMDRGKGHVEFLRTIYLRCKPWMHETLAYLDHGLDTAKEMEDRYASAKPLIHDEGFAAEVEKSLRVTRLLVETNNLYVKTLFAFFQYRDERTDTAREALRARHAALKATRDEFTEAVAGGYDLAGVDQLLANAGEVLEDLARAEERLANAPRPDEIERAVEAQQRRYREILEERGDAAVKVLYWEGRVDGTDILAVQGDTVAIEHLRWDPIYIQNHEMRASLPDKEVTVVPEDIESEAMHPFMLEQPTEANGYTAKVYLCDVPGGAHWFKFNLYYIDESPEALGLATPWD